MLDVVEERDWREPRKELFIQQAYQDLNQACQQFSGVCLFAWQTWPSLGWAELLLVSRHASHVAQVTRLPRWLRVQPNKLDDDSIMLGYHMWGTTNSASGSG